MSKKAEQGQSLVEVIFMIGFSFLILTGLVAGVVFTIKTARFAKNKAEATRLAREKVEELKGEKQGSGFWEKEEVLNESCSTETVDNFERETCFSNFSSNGEKRIDVDVTVFWAGQEQSKIVLNTYLSNWEK